MDSKAFNVDTILNDKNVLFSSKDSIGVLQEFDHNPSLDAIRFRLRHQNNFDQNKLLITPKHIILQTPINRYADLLMDCELNLVKDGKYVDQTIVENTNLTLGDTEGIVLCNDINNIHKYPYPILITPYNSLNANMYLNLNTNVKRISCEFLNTYCHLNDKDRSNIMKNKKFVYHDRLIIDYESISFFDAEQHLKCFDDFNVQYKKDTYRYLLQDKKFKFPHDILNIKNIQLGIVDVNNGYELVDNYISGVKILITGMLAYEQEYKEQNTLFINVDTEPIPIQYLSYSEVIIDITTKHAIEDNHMLMLQCMRSESIKYNNDVPIKLFNGFIKNSTWSLG